jgi:hypothetical protein
MIQRKVHEREDSLLPLISSEILRKTLEKENPGISTPGLKQQINL